MALLRNVVPPLLNMRPPRGTAEATRRNLTGYDMIPKTGIHLDVSHTAATPIGLRVTATAEVLRVEGRTITFRVDARDEFEPIGGGTHQRVVVSVARFDERVQHKLTGRGAN
jgi:hypothetical protein